MATDSDLALIRMFEICWNQKSKFPTPSSCKDYQLVEFHNDMLYEWSINDELLNRTFKQPLDNTEIIDYGLDIKEEEAILNRLYYIEDMLEEIDYEISLRPPAACFRNLQPNRFY